MTSGVPHLPNTLTVRYPPAFGYQRQIRRGLDVILDSTVNQRHQLLCSSIRQNFVSKFPLFINTSFNLVFRWERKRLARWKKSAYHLLLTTTYSLRTKMCAFRLTGDDCRKSYRRTQRKANKMTFLLLAHVTSQENHTLPCHQSGETYTRTHKGPTGRKACVFCEKGLFTSNIFVFLWVHGRGWLKNVPFLLLHQAEFFKGSVQATRLIRFSKIRYDCNSTLV